MPEFQESDSKAATENNSEAPSAPETPNFNFIDAARDSAKNSASSAVSELSPNFTDSAKNKASSAVSEQSPNFTDSAKNSASSAVSELSPNFTDSAKNKTSAAPLDRNFSSNDAAMQSAREQDKGPDTAAIAASIIKNQGFGRGEDRRAIEDALADAMENGKFASKDLVKEINNELSRQGSNIRLKDQVSGGGGGSKHGDFREEHTELKGKFSITENGRDKDQMNIKITKDVVTENGKVVGAHSSREGDFGGGGGGWGKQPEYLNNKNDDFKLDEFKLEDGGGKGGGGGGGGGKGGGKDSNYEYHGGGASGKPNSGAPDAAGKTHAEAAGAQKTDKPGGASGNKSESNEKKDNQAPNSAGNYEYHQQ